MVQQTDQQEAYGRYQNAICQQGARKQGAVAQDVEQFSATDTQPDGDHHDCDEEVFERSLQAHVCKRETSMPYSVEEARLRRTLQGNKPLRPPTTLFSQAPKHKEKPLRGIALGAALAGAVCANVSVARSNAAHNPVNLCVSFILPVRLQHRPLRPRARPSQDPLAKGAGLHNALKHTQPEITEGWRCNSIHAVRSWHR